MPISPLQFQEMQARLAWSRNKLPPCKTHAEIDTAIEEAGEGLLHNQIIAECRRRLWPYVHSAMNRKTTTALGTPDFVIAASNGYTLFLEVKAGRNKLTPEQRGFGAMLARNGHVLHEVRSFVQFLQVINSL